MNGLIKEKFDSGVSLQHFKSKLEKLRRVPVDQYYYYNGHNLPMLFGIFSCNRFLKTH